MKRVGDEIISFEPTNKNFPFLNLLRSLWRNAYVFFLVLASAILGKEVIRVSMLQTTNWFVIKKKTRMRNSNFLPRNKDNAGTFGNNRFPYFFEEKPQIYGLRLL